TRAYVHHDLHYPYHHSADAADQERALAHLEAAVDLAPEFFFDLAHILVRPRWARERERLARGHDLAAVARRGLEFTRHQFDNDEALRELAELGLDVGEYDAVHEFLAHGVVLPDVQAEDRKSTRLNSSHLGISYAV